MVVMSKDISNHAHPLISGDTDEFHAKKAFVSQTPDSAV